MDLFLTEQKSDAEVTLMKRRINYDDDGSSMCHCTCLDHIGLKTGGAPVVTWWSAPACPGLRYHYYRESSHLEDTMVL